MTRPMAGQPAAPRETPLDQYLRRHAEPEAALAAEVPDPFASALVIPAFRERPEFVARLFANLAEAPPFLLVLVVNQPDHLGDDSDTTALWAALGGTSYEELLGIALLLGAVASAATGCAS